MTLTLECFLPTIKTPPKGPHGTARRRCRGFGKPSNTTRALGDWLWNGKMVGYWSSTAWHA